MSGVHRLLASAVLIAALAAPARADAPTFAVDLRSKDGLADKLAGTLEDALRAAGSAKTADYRAKGTRKDRIAASTDACPNALTPACAVAIGGTLGVDYLFAGTLETRGKRVMIAIDMVSVRTGKRVRSLRDYAPSSTDARKWARSIYDRLVDHATGSLQISCNAPRAAILVDGQPATELYQGRGTVDGLALGTHAIEIRAPGYKPYVGEVTIDGATPLNVLLERS